MKTTCSVLICLLALMVGCQRKNATPSVNQPAAAWSDDSLVLRHQFQGWVQKFRDMEEREYVRVAGKLITDESGHPERQSRLFALAEQYFHDPNSPYRSEDLYIPILEAFIGDTLIREEAKERARYQLERAMMNRPGSVAADLPLLAVQGKRLRLHEVESAYTLLYFFNPECHDCKRVTQYIAVSPVFLSLQNQRLLKVVAVYPDEDLGAWERHKHELPATWLASRCDAVEVEKAYDLPAIPTLYLLDKDKRVVLKDAPVEYIASWCEHNFLPDGKRNKVGN